MAVEEVPVVIVGAGFAGLSAACELKKRAPELKFVVLEAKNRLGGRTHTISMRAARGIDKWDIGGQWVGATQTQLLELMRELRVDKFPQFVDGKKLCQLGDEKIRPYTSVLPVHQLSPLAVVDFVRCMRALDATSKQTPPTDPFGADRAWAAELDSQTVASYAAQLCHTDVIPECMDIAVRTSLGVSTSRISMLYLAVDANAHHSFNEMIEPTGDGAQGFRIVGGTERLIQGMRERIRAGLPADAAEKVIRVESVVEKVVQDEQAGIASGFPVRIFYRRAGEKELQEIHCKRIILAIPPNQAARIDFEPLLPEDKRQLLSVWSQGNLLKFLVTYERAFWRERGYSGEIVASCRTSQTDVFNPVMVTYDATSSNGNAAIVGFMHTSWAATEPAQRRAAVLKDLARYLGDDALNALDYQDKNWSEEPFSGGCPVGVLAPGSMHLFATSARSITGRVHWAGTETATQFMGYISGAIQSGWRAAHEVLFNLAPDSVTEADLADTHYRAKRPASANVAYGRRRGAVRTLVKAGVVAVGILLCYKLARRAGTGGEVGVVERLSSRLRLLY